MANYTIFILVRQILFQTIHNLLIFDQLSKTIKEPNPLPKSIDFVPAQELAVDIPTNDIGKVDMYIDDTIGFALDLGDNVTIVQNAVPMVINAFARPLNESETTTKLKSNLPKEIPSRREDGRDKSSAWLGYQHLHLTNFSPSR